MKWHPSKRDYLTYISVPDNKVHGANMGPTRVLSSPCGPHVGPMDLGIWGNQRNVNMYSMKTHPSKQAVLIHICVFS